MQTALADNVVHFKLGKLEFFSFVIPEKLPPSFNDLINKSPQWRDNQSKWWQHYMSRYCRAVPTVYLVKRTVRIDLFKKSQPDDLPNLDARSKIPLDCMKQLGMIVDDNNKWLDWARVWQRKHPNMNATVVTLTEGCNAETLQGLHDMAPIALRMVIESGSGN